MIYEKQIEDDWIERKIKVMFKPLSVEKRKHYFKNCQLSKQENSLQAFKITRTQLEEPWNIFLAKSKLRLYK